MSMYTLSVSMESFSFYQKMSEWVLGVMPINLVEYNENYKWKSSTKGEITNINSSQYRFHIEHGETEFLFQNMNNSLPRLMVAKVQFELLEVLIGRIESNFINEIVTARATDRMDGILQNSDDLEGWELYGRKVPQYAEIIKHPKFIPGGVNTYGEPNKPCVSIESLPGHSHIMNYGDKLWFGSCWLMYFSPIYYKYIPKPLFDDFTECHEHTIFENGLRKIVLFKNAEDYDLPESRAKQWAFRRQLGIDSIAHELTRANNRIEPENIPVLITKKECKVGQTRVTRFLDGNGKLISSDKAIKKEIKEYLDDGITVVFEETEEIRKSIWPWKK